VYVSGCSEGAAECAPMKAQLGFGPPATDPQASPAAYTWTDATYNSAHVGDSNDEYSAQATPGAAGTFAYVYRFSTDIGTSWTYCDTNGSDGFQTAQLGALTVAVRTIDWCMIQSPPSVTITHGQSTGAIYGRVHSAGCTDGAAWCGGVISQLGWGPQSVDPSANPGGYTWVQASYNPGHTSDDNDEYSADITPASAGTYDYVYRFSGDGGTTWRYCDTQDHATFSASAAGVMTVN
jgi:hypothetical protein